MAEDKKATQYGGTENKKIKMNVGGTDIEATIDEKGRIIMPGEVKDIMGASISVMKQSEEIVSNGYEKTEKKSGAASNGFTDNFKGLPMRELIGAPLFAAAEAQEKLASISWDYYKKIAYNTDEKGDTTSETRLLEFTLDRPTVQDGVVSSENNKVTVKAPIIGLASIPSLQIDRVDVDFQMEVTDSNKETDDQSAKASTDISLK